MPEKDGELSDTKHEQESRSSMPASSVGKTKQENYESLPDTQHDFTKKELICILEFIDSRAMKNEYKIFLKMRWLKAVLHLENESEKNKNRYDVFSVIVLIASAIITSLTGANLAETAKLFPINLTINTFLGELTILRFGNESTLPATLFILGLTVTITVGLMNLFKFDEVRWKKRIYAEKLKKEGFEFLQLINEYRPDDAASYYAAYDTEYPQFAEKVEELINEVNEGYTNLFGGGKPKDQLKESLIKPDQKVKGKDE